jgi:hypothetical protein
MKKGISFLEYVICGIAFISIAAFVYLMFWLASGS